MATNYNGSATGISAREQVTISVPAGTDVRNSQSVRTPIEKLADFCQYLMAKVGLIDQVSTWTAKQNMTGGIGGLPLPAAGSNDAARKVDVEAAETAAKSHANGLTTAAIWTQITPGAGWTTLGVGYGVKATKAGGAIYIHVSGLKWTGATGFPSDNITNVLPSQFAPATYQHGMLLSASTSGAIGVGIAPASGGLGTLVCKSQLTTNDFIEGMLVYPAGV